MNKAAVIVAGGKGTRLPGNLAKQFQELQGLPVLMHTIAAFHSYDDAVRVILVLPSPDMETWEHLCIRHNFKIPLTTVAGGSSRFQSVKNGLNVLQGPGLVAVHDGVRPLVTAQIIATSFDTAERCRSAVASVPLKESIREMSDAYVSRDQIVDEKTQDNGNYRSRALDRTRYRIMQTPQTFDIDLLKAAYALPEDESLTDDASVVERSGHTITLFDGSYENLKITTPEDLVLAGALLKIRLNT